MLVIQSFIFKLICYYLLSSLLLKQMVIVANRTINVGSQIFSAHDIGLQILQVSWHPYSSSHVGILSSDSVLRYKCLTIYINLISHFVVKLVACHVRVHFARVTNFRAVHACLCIQCIKNSRM